MSRPNFQQIAQDLELRYSGTYIQYREDESKDFQTVHVAAIQSYAEDYPVLTLLSLKGLTTASYRGKGEFNFTLPPNGYFDYRGNSYISYYKPSRQNKRSLCSGNSVRNNFYTLNKLCSSVVLDIHVATNIYSPKYASVQSALDILNRRNKYCVALSREYALGLNITDSKNHLLFHYLTPIAEVGEDGSIVRVSHPTLERLVYASPITRL